MTDIDPSKKPEWDSRFFQADIPSIPEPVSDLLSTYSNIPLSEQKSHVLTLRNEAYKARPYPCLGRFRFLDLSLSSYPLYESYVLPTLQKAANDINPNDNNAETTALENGPIFLDLGTCLGQDIRKLIHDGASPIHIYGSDIIPSFIETGYKLFRDEQIMPKSHFLVPGDVFSLPSSSPSTTTTTDNVIQSSPDHDALHHLHNKVTILHITAVFHLFPLSDQKQVAHKCLHLLRKTPSTPFLILGGQAGNIQSGHTTRVADGKQRYRHNLDSWREMWEDVVRGDEWKSKVIKIEVDGILEDDMDFDAGRESTGGGVGADSGMESKRRRKVIGEGDQGFRWHVFWVWVEFNG